MHVAKAREDVVVDFYWIFVILDRWGEVDGW